MSKTVLLASFLVAVATGMMVVGCGQQPSAPSEATPDKPAAESDEGQEQASSPDAGSAGDSKYEAALAELPPEDRALAEKQKVCPVSGEPLGAMGKPYKVTVEGQDVLLCCQGCESKIKENPEQYLAKLNK